MISYTTGKEKSIRNMKFYVNISAYFNKKGAGIKWGNMVFTFAFLCAIMYAVKIGVLVPRYDTKSGKDGVLLCHPYII